MTSNPTSQESRPNASRRFAGANWKSRSVQSSTRTHSSSRIPGNTEEDNKPKPTNNSSRARYRRKDNSSHTGLYIGMDCEMVGIGAGGKEDMLARVSLIDRNGAVLLDKFVKPQCPVTDYRTPISGVRPMDMANGEDFSKVKDEVHKILNGKIIVGHGLKSDLSVLHIKHPYVNIRDTSTYKPLCRIASSNGRTPSLKKLAKIVLNIDIQNGEHNSIEDARAAMNIYNRLSHEWEVFHQKKFSRRN